MFEDSVDRSPGNYIFGTTRFNRSKVTNDEVGDGERESSPNTASKISALQRWLKEEETRANERKGIPGDLPPELMTVSVKDLVKAIGESRANGNGVTPPNTPPRPRASQSTSPKPVMHHVTYRGRSGSSPISIPSTRGRLSAAVSAYEGHRLCPGE